MIDREAKIRKTDEIVSKAISLWPLWMALAGGAVTAVNFYQKVNDIIRKQENFEAQSDQRKDKNSLEKEDIRNRLTKVEADISWIKHDLSSLRP